MADNLIGGGGSAGMASIISQIQANQQAHTSAASSDEASDEASRAQLLKAMLLKKQAAAQDSKHFQDTREHGAHKRLLRAQSGELGTGAAAWANAKAAQDKLTAKQKQMFLSAAEGREPHAQRAGAAMAELSRAPAFRAVVDAPLAGEMQSKLLREPRAEGALKEALGHDYVAGRGGDRDAKKQFLRYAARFGNERGISVRMGGDMLGTLSKRGVLGSGQLAVIGMAERNPDNVRGMGNIDGFMQRPEVDILSAASRTEAVEVLARAEGSDEVRAGLETLVGEGKFRALGGSGPDSALRTIKMGLPSELRAITDQVLVSLRAPNFPSHSSQVSTFLTGLGKQIGRGGSSSVDPRGLIREAKRTGMPLPPQLVSTERDDDEEAQQEASRHNRSAVMQYYKDLGKQYRGIEKAVKNAKYREDISLLRLALKPAETPDLSALRVRDDVRSDYEGQFAALADELKSRRLTRAEYVVETKKLFTQALARPDLSVDEQTWVQVHATEARMAQTFNELVGRANRKGREVDKNIMPAARRRRLAEQKRQVGTQKRYFRMDGQGPVARTTGAPAAAQQLQGAAAGASQAQGLGAGAPAAGQDALRRFERATAGLDPSAANYAQKLQAAVQTVTQDVQREFTTMLGKASAAIAQTLARESAKMAQGARLPAAAGPRDAAPAGLGALEDAAGAPAPAAAGGLADLIGRATQGGAQPAERASTMQGRVDGYGIPRTFERDLGAAAGVVPVRPARVAGAAAQPSMPHEPDDAPELPRADGAGARIFKPTTELRDEESLRQVTWKGLTRPETAALRNLNWDHATWNARFEPQASWPATYQTPFAQLSQAQRSSVLGLGYTASSWDASAARLLAAMGRG